MTGLGHISGVEDQIVSIGDMRDPPRIMAGGRDRLDNIGQIKRLRQRGYDGLFSFEPFAPSAHDRSDMGGPIRASMVFVREKVGADDLQPV